MQGFRGVSLFFSIFFCLLSNTGHTSTHKAHHKKPLKKISNSQVLIQDARPFGSYYSNQLPVWDHEFSCVDVATANRYITEFKINVQSFGGKELCNANVDTKKLFNDLFLIERGEFNQNGANAFIKGFVREPYYDWMKTQTFGITRGNNVPFATAYNQGGYFTMQDGWTKLSSLARVGVVIHEARHTEGYTHTSCDHGPYTGSFVQGCDDTYEYGGSHAIEMEYYARVVTQGSNFHPVYKTMARLMAMARSNWVFNTRVLKMREGLMLIDRANSQPILLTQSQIYQREVPPMAAGILKRSSFGAVLMQFPRAIAIDPYGITGLNPPILDDYSYFKLLKEDRGQGAILDMEEFDVANTRYVMALRTDNTFAFYNFPSGKWSSFSQKILFASRLTTTAPSGETGIFFINGRGDVIPYDVNTSQASAPLATKWQPNLVSVTTYNGQTLVLKTDGAVVDAKNNIPLPELNGKQFNQMVTVPLYDVFEVK